MAAAEKDESNDKPRRGGLMSLVKVAAFILVVVIVEVVAASFLLPSAKDVEATARDLANARQGEEIDDDSDGLEEAADDATPTMEARLGLFNVTRYNPEKDTTMIIDFEVYGVVELAEQADFEERFAKHEIRIREQVIMTLQGAEATDLRGEGLGLIKRRLLEKTNRSLGRPLVRDVVFSKFNFVER